MIDLLPHLSGSEFVTNRTPFIAITQLFTNLSVFDGFVFSGNLLKLPRYVRANG